MKENEPFFSFPDRYRPPPYIVVYHSLYYMTILIDPRSSALYSIFDLTIVLYYDVNCTRVVIPD